MLHGFFRLSGGRRVIALLGLFLGPIVGVLLAPEARFPDHVGVTVFISAVGMFLFTLVLLWTGLAQVTDVSLINAAPSESAIDPKEIAAQAGDADHPPRQPDQYDSGNHRSQLCALRELVAVDPQRAAQVLKRWITADA